MKIIIRLVIIFIIAVVGYKGTIDYQAIQKQKLLEKNVVSVVKNDISKLKKWSESEINLANLPASKEDIKRRVSDINEKIEILKYEESLAADLSKDLETYSKRYLDNIEAKKINVEAEQFEILKVEAKKLIAYNKETVNHKKLEISVIELTERFQKLKEQSDSLTLNRSEIKAMIQDVELNINEYKKKVEKSKKDEETREKEEKRKKEEALKKERQKKAEQTLLEKLNFDVSVHDKKKYKVTVKNMTAIDFELDSNKLELELTSKNSGNLVLSPSYTEKKKSKPNETIVFDALFEDVSIKAIGYESLKLLYNGHEVLLKELQKDKSENDVLGSTEEQQTQLTEAKNLIINHLSVDITSPQGEKILADMIENYGILGRPYKDGQWPESIVSENERARKGSKNYDDIMGTNFSMEYPENKYAAAK